MTASIRKEGQKSQKIKLIKYEVSFTSPVKQLTGLHLQMSVKSYDGLKATERRKFGHELHLRKLL